MAYRPAPEGTPEGPSLLLEGNPLLLDSVPVARHRNEARSTAPESGRLKLGVDLGTKERQQKIQPVGAASEVCGAKPQEL